MRNPIRFPWPALISVSQSFRTASLHCFPSSIRSELAHSRLLHRFRTLLNLQPLPALVLHRRTLCYPSPRLLGRVFGRFGTDEESGCTRFARMQRPLRSRTSDPASLNSLDAATRHSGRHFRRTSPRSLFLSANLVLFPFLPTDSDRTRAGC